jgi:membrane associated rhomboid family serine protease
MRFGTGSYEAFVGVSGGLFAMYGTVLAAAWFTNRLLPPGMLAVCAAVAVTSLIGASLLSANMANVAHVAGLLFGAASSLIVRPLFLAVAHDAPSREPA